MAYWTQDERRYTSRTDRNEVDFDHKAELAERQRMRKVKRQTTRSAVNLQLKLRGNYSE